ncbi:MAG: hypothetical protein J5372_04310 [Lachnospiraceae bacterium]|nr:hypothetical protein [Lachnospiraceae bacterium]
MRKSIRLKLFVSLVAVSLMFCFVNGSIGINASTVETYISEAEFYEQEKIKAEEVGLIIGNGVKLDEVYDGTEVVAEREDFETIENYKAYLERRGLHYVESEFDKELNALEDEDAVLTSIIPEAVYTANLTTQQKPIQSFMVDGSNIYISQSYKSWYFYVDGELTNVPGNYVLISRCTIASDNSFSRADAMLLKDVGHGETLEKYTYNNNTYFWISCGASQISEADRVWSVQMGRIQYVGYSMTALKNQSNLIDNTQIKRLVDLSYSNSNATSFGTMRRSNSAISSDGQYLLIWKRSTSGTNQFSIYDFSTINSQLSSAIGNTVSFYGNNVLKNACTTSYNQSGMAASVQGIDLSNISGGLHSIYQSSGNENDPDSGVNKIHRFNSAGVHKKEVTIDDTGLWTAYNQSATHNAIAEIEGMKISGSYLLFVIRDTENYDRQVIARTLKSNLS